MMDYGDISKAIQDQLVGNSTFKAILRNQSVSRGEFLNSESRFTPWAGVYRGKIKFEPMTLGSVQNWEFKGEVRVLLQVSNKESGEKCEDTLEDFVKAAHDAILSDTTIGGTVDIVTGFEVEYSYKEDERSGLHFQLATITYRFEGDTDGN